MLPPGLRHPETHSKEYASSITLRQLLSVTASTFNHPSETSGPVPSYSPGSLVFLGRVATQLFSTDILKMGAGQFFRDCGASREKAIDAVGCAIASRGIAHEGSAPAVIEWDSRAMTGL